MTGNAPGTAHGLRAFSRRPRYNDHISALKVVLRAGAHMVKNGDRNSTHLSGEYSVAAERYLRGGSVAMTLGNAKAIELFGERGERTVNVQVKAIRDKKSVGWPIMKASIRQNINH